MRLATHVEAVSEPPKFEEMAQIAIAQGLPGEAQSCIEEAFNKKGIVDARQASNGTRSCWRKPRPRRCDKTTLAQAGNLRARQAAGDADVKLGAAYLSYGENAKAIEALQRGIGKGGVQDPDEAGLLLGIAHLRAGNKPEAAKAFSTVTRTPRWRASRSCGC